MGSYLGCRGQGSQAQSCGHLLLVMLQGPSGVEELEERNVSFATGQLDGDGETYNYRGWFG